MKLDLTGNTYGRLTVLGDDRTRTKSGKVLWHCLCECGNTTHVRADHLKNGSIVSCGCLSDEKKHDRFKDLTNIETDNFKVIDRAYSKNQRVYWNCICKHCGSSVILNSNLIDNQTSCGCKRGATKDYMDSIRDPDSRKSTKPTTRNSTGVRGVYYNKRKKNYQAFINVDKKTKYLGSSSSLEEAAKIRREAELRYGYKRP